MFDVKSISAAIAEVQRLRESIDTGSKKLVDKLAEEAVKKASEEYETAEYAGEKEVNVASVKTAPLKATVQATGSSVLFIEFGTGINKSDSPEARADLKSGNVVGHGQYGHHLGRLKTGWRYTGSIGVAFRIVTTSLVPFSLLNVVSIGTSNLTHSLTIGNSASSFPTRPTCPINGSSRSQTRE